MKSKFQLSILSFLHGAIWMIFFVFWIMSNYEDGLYDQIVKNTLTDNISNQQKAILLLHKTHLLLKPREELFIDEENINLRDALFRSSDIQLIDAKEDCASYTHVLGRLLQRAGFTVRIAQMKCGESWGCHILLEANIDGKFAALDPLYDVAFKKTDGTLASFDEIGQNWDLYKLQVPENYPSGFAYEDVRYTNWDKIPVLMPFFRKILGTVMKNEIETMSIRSMVLNVYKTYMILLSIFYIGLIAASFFILRSKKVQQ